MSNYSTQIVGVEFSLFSEEWKFHHLIYKASFPQANGLVKRPVQTTKHLLKKAKTGSLSPYLMQSFRI